MYLTTENAEQFMGRTLDCHKRMFHHYPLRIQKLPDGRCVYVDRTGTAMLVPEPKDRFNSVWFDFVVEPPEKQEKNAAALTTATE